MQQNTIIDIALGVTTAIALSCSVWALLRLRAFNRDLLLVRDASDEQSLVASVASQIRSVDGLRDDVAAVQKSLAIAQRDLNAAMRHVSVVRYDAFGDMGGRLSFSAAILDDNGDGVLLTSIHGHTESRMYIKTVTRLKADGRVSPEELEAITTASPIGA
jgi:hypothetical protein